MTPTVWHGCFETQREGCVVNQSYSKKLKMGTKKGILVSFRNFSISHIVKRGVKGDPNSDIGPLGQNLGQKPCYPPDLRNKNGKGPSEHP